MVQPIRVLIADDDLECCEMVQRELAKRNDLLLAGAAHRGEAALSLIAELRPDVLLLDLVMPGLDGIGVLERLREPSLGFRPHVIALTAVETASLAQQVLELGADYYVIKPIAPDVLCTRIWQVMREPGRRPAPAPYPVAAEAAVTRTLSELGIPTTFKGFGLLREAVLLVLEDDRRLAEITHRLYPEVGERCDTSAALVERNLRHAIEHAWTHGDVDTLYSAFGSTIRAETGKPTNSAFIARVADMIRLSGVV